jgi:hypothetical protein
MSQAYFALKQRAATPILAVLAIIAILSFAAGAVTILEHGTAMALSPRELSPALG